MSKTFGYIAIIALFTVVGFFVIMDILKYCFGIDPVREERELLRRRRAALERENRENGRYSPAVNQVSPAQTSFKTRRRITRRH